MSNFDRRTDWEARRDAAFNRAIVDRTLVASALYNLLTIVQTERYGPISPRLRQAEIEATRALSIVGGPSVPETRPMFVKGEDDAAASAVSSELNVIAPPI